MVVCKALIGNSPGSLARSPTHPLSPLLPTSPVCDFFFFNVRIRVSKNNAFSGFILMSCSEWNQ